MAQEATEKKSFVDAMMPFVYKIAGPLTKFGQFDFVKVITNGMAGYTTDISRAARAGSNPLVVRAVSLDNHNGNPVLSVADANRVLIENGATGFVDSARVVFLR